MKIRTQEKEFKDWKTSIQWQKEHKEVVEKDDFEKLWINGWCKISAKFYSPDNTRDMTQEEIDKYTEDIRNKRRESYKRRKDRLKEIQRQEEELCQRRNEWKTDFQWLNENRRVNKEAQWRKGYELNQSKDDYSPFSQFYLYCHISDTTLFISDIEKDKELNRLLSQLEEKNWNEHQTLKKEIEQRNIQSLPRLQKEYFTAYDLLDMNKKIKDFNYYELPRRLNIHKTDEEPFKLNEIYYSLSDNTEDIVNEEERNNEFVRIKEELEKINDDIKKRKKRKISFIDGKIEYCYKLLSEDDVYINCIRYKSQELEMLIKSIKNILSYYKTLDSDDIKTFKKLIVRINKILLLENNKITVDDFEEFKFTENEFILLRQSLKKSFSEITQLIYIEHNENEKERLLNQRNEYKKLRDKIYDNLISQFYDLETI